MEYNPPKHRQLPHILSQLFQGLGVAASIFAFIKIDEVIPDNSSGMVYALFLVAVTVTLAGYIFMLHLRKLHRFADIPPFTHFVNHTIRNVLTRTRRKCSSNTFTDEDLEEIEIATVAILDAISRCFSILTGSHCGVCIKEFHHGDTPHVRVAYRDSLSQATRGADDGDQPPHAIEEDTPCYRSFLGDKGCGRGYLCNNVKDEWLGGRYKSPSFTRYSGAEPTCLKVLGFSFIRNWNIYYSCAMVSPIRYRALSKNGGKIPKHNIYGNAGIRYWGFLCIDARKRNLFSESRHRDILATFSDALFIYFNELHDIVDRYTSPTSPPSK